MVARVQRSFSASARVGFYGGTVAENSVSQPSDDIARRLAALGTRGNDTLTGRFPRGDSAVLVLVVLDDEPGLVLTRRSPDLRTDPGFVAFPGGRIDPGETPEFAAQRECEEEVGVSPHAITVHGRLDDTWNGAGFRIIPVVASIRGPLVLALQSSEVSSAAVVPLAHATARDNHEIVVKHIDGFDFHDDVITFGVDIDVGRTDDP
jgi:8-oxo-dGTP pyrophosphatase MutT (NUDIX family)